MDLPHRAITYVCNLHTNKQFNAIHMNKMTSPGIAPKKFVYFLAKYSFLFAVLCMRMAIAQTTPVAPMDPFQAAEQQTMRLQAMQQDNAEINRLRQELRAIETNMPAKRAAIGGTVVAEYGAAGATGCRYCNMTPAKLRKRLKSNNQLMAYLTVGNK